MTLQAVKATAPSAWASYLINHDASSLDDGEVNIIKAWLRREGMGFPVDCDDAGFVRWHDAYTLFPFAADCQAYTFLIP